MNIPVSLEFVKNDKFVKIAGGALLFAAGAAAGYVTSVRILEEKYIAIAEQEVAKSADYYKRLYKTEEFATPEAAAESLGIPIPLVPEHPTLEGDKLMDQMTSPESVRPEVTRINTFETNNNEEPDNTGVPTEEERATYELEGTPYVIIEEEYAQNSEEFEQVTMTYYEEDDVLVDPTSEVVPDVDEVVGEDNLQKFGIGSGNNRMVYVRNPRLEMEFQIIKSQRSFAADVHGFIEHAEPRPTMRRTRPGRDE